jgi:hypothetical protein
MKAKQTFPIFFSLLVSYNIQAQKLQTKLEVKAKETYVVGPENYLKVDTLIMHDKATIQFQGTKNGILEAQHVIIGEKCTISSRGADGKRGEEGNPGTDGQHGGSLSLIMHFIKLGDLTIDTQGGDGGDGQNGKNGFQGSMEREETRAVKDPNGKVTYNTVIIPGKQGTDGTDATLGGNGGNGGNIMLVYRTNGFIPNFNPEGKARNSINILYQAGQTGRTGSPGKGGLQSIDGIVKYSERTVAQDGKVDLVNLDQQVSK